MSDTQLIEEIRAVRHKIAMECGNNLAEIARRAREAAEHLGFKVSRLETHSI